MLAGIRSKFANVLAKREMNLGQLTYRGFMAGAKAIEQQESVRFLLEPWLDTESPAS